MKSQECSRNLCFFSCYFLLQDQLQKLGDPVQWKCRDPCLQSIWRRRQRSIQPRARPLSVLGPCDLALASHPRPVYCWRLTSSPVSPSALTSSRHHEADWQTTFSPCAASAFRPKSQKERGKGQGPRFKVKWSVSDFNCNLHFIG